MNKEQIFQANRAIIKAKTHGAEMKSIRRFCGHAGIEHFSFQSTILSPSTSSPKTNLLDGYPPAWRQRYRDAQYARTDMTLEHCRNNTAPLHWVEAPYKLNKINKKMFSEAAEFGIVSGISYPFHGVNGEMAVFNATVSTELSKSPLKSLTAQYGVYLLGATLFDKQKQAKRGNYAEILTRREIECLRWAADGKTAWDISKLLKISERTVVFHFDNSRKKLNAQSRIETVSKALLLSLL